MQTVIIAAGESSRFWPLNNKHKSQVKIYGKPLVYWTLKSIAEKGIRDIILVTGPKSLLKEDLAPFIQDLQVNLSFVIQEKPLGTGNAVSLAKNYIKEPFFVFWPYKIIAGQMIQDVLSLTEKTKAEIVLTGAPTDTPWDFGILKMENNKVVEIAENPEKGKEPSNVKVLGAYFLQPDFFEYYQKIKNHHPEDFVDALNLYIRDKKAGLLLLEKDVPVLKYPWQLLEVLRMKSKDFANFVSPTAQIGENVVMSGNIFVGDNTLIGAGTVIQGPWFIGDNCKIGANNVLRGPVDLEKDVVTGAFAEIKNCVIQEGTHLHSGYFGDSVIGGNCRFGAGFVTANRRIDRQNILSLVKGKKMDTGLTRLGLIAGDNVHFGIHSGTMPGVLVGSDCTVGPGTLVFENLENNSKIFSKFNQKKK
jgi:bifunctional UDP-N-acetylglucosamine pyrophosphorylase/glucosamine-1-phosphate N-acetyltransferase